MKRGHASVIKRFQPLYSKRQISPDWGCCRRNRRAMTEPNFLNHRRIVSYRNVDPTFYKHLFGLPQAEIEPAIDPDCVCDDFRWKPVTFEVNRRCTHQSCPIANAPTSNLRWFLCDDTTCEKASTSKVRRCAGAAGPRHRAGDGPPVDNASPSPAD